MSNSLMQQSVASVRWSALAQLVGQVAQYGSFVLLARLLSPTDFGVVACATLVIGFVSMLNELGMGAALIQRAELTPRHLNAAFWSNLGTALLLWAALAALAHPIASYFNSEAAAPLLAALAISFPLVGLVVVPKSLMERELRFKALGAVDAIAAMVTAAVSVGLAAAHYGAWSLVAGTLGGYVVQAAMLPVLARWRPGLAFGREELKGLFAFGSSVLGTRLLGYFNGNIDYLLIGHFLGPAALGAYSLAYKLVTWPMLKVSHVTLRVMYPAFARLQHDDAALREHYLAVVSTLALVAFPLLAALGVLAPVAVPLLFGPHWEGAVLPTQILCGVGAVKALGCSIGSIFLTKGRPDIELMTNVVTCALLCVVVYAGVHYGIVGVALAMLVATLIGAPWQQAVAGRMIGLTQRQCLEVARRPAVAAGVGAIALFGLMQLAASLPGALVVALAVPVMGLAYLGTLSLQGVDWLAKAQGFLGRAPKSEPAPGAVVPLRSRDRRRFKLPPQAS